MADELAECAVGARNNGAYVRCINQRTNAWKQAGLLSRNEKGRIVSCDARAPIPPPEE